MQVLVACVKVIARLTFNSKFHGLLLQITEFVDKVPASQNLDPMAAIVRSYVQADICQLQCIRSAFMLRVYLRHFGLTLKDYFTKIS